MRVVAGSARGMRLNRVPGNGTRPILDRVKTALFDILRPRIPGMEMLDLFAGSGGIGIEALSQGASSCTFIDLAPRAVRTIKQNLALTGFSGRSEVRQADALGYLAGARKTFDLIFIAPPQYKGLWAEALRNLAERPDLLRRPSSGADGGREAGLAIAQIDPREYERLDLGEIRETRQKRYGNSLLVFFELRDGPDPE
jgi:16S rRNA (guanine966-N2)-methyltransferase